VAHVICDGADADADADVDAEQVRSGMAWVFDKYITDRGLDAVQDEARAARRGLGVIVSRCAVGVVCGWAVADNGLRFGRA